MTSSKEHMDTVVDLINGAKMEAKEQKLHLLAQVKEICINRQPSLLPEVIPMIAEFQTEFNANARKFVASFMRDVVRQHPQHVALVVPVASFLMHDSNTHVKKIAALLANTIYRPALQRLVENGHSKNAQKDWSALDGLRKLVLQTITSGPPDISMVAIKFAESVVLACVGGKGLGPGSSRDGDKSVQRDLSHSHPFLRADTLDQAGHALARQMVGWLASSSGGGGGGSKASGWGTGFGAQHYTVLINALQSLATNRAALFADIVPALASALESVATNDGKMGRGKNGKTPVVEKAEVPKGLQDAASSLRSACLKLLKVAPSPSKAVQRLAEAAAASGSDGEATAAVEGNIALRGHIKVTSGAHAAAAAARVSRGNRASSPAPGKVWAVTPENLRAHADLAAKASQGKVPKPPPGYKSNRTQGFPLENLEMLFGHVLNALGADLVAQPPTKTKTEAGEKPAAGGKRARSPGPDEAGKNKRALGNSGKRTDQKAESNTDGGRRSPMEVVDDNKIVAGRKATSAASGKESREEKEPGPEEAVGDLEQEGLDSARNAFSRVLGLWEGATAEGKRGLHQRMVARLGRMLSEAEAAWEAAAGDVGSKKRKRKEAKGDETQPKVVTEVVDFVTQDYKRHFQAALALLTEMYVADVSAKTAPAAPTKAASLNDPKGSRGNGKRTSEGRSAEAESRARSTRQARGFELYDKALVSLLDKLSESLELSWRQKLFTQTLLECPRVPPPALELVCNLCDMAAKPHEVQTGLVSLKDMIFHKPATRSVCIPSVLRFTYHSDLDVRTKAVRLASNLLYPDKAFQSTIEAFAKQALASVKNPEVKPKEAKEEDEKGIKQEIKQARPKPDPVVDEEEDVVDFEGDDDEDDEPEPEPEPASDSKQTLKSSPSPDPSKSTEVRVVGPWLTPPDTEASARIRLSLYFALCVKSRPMLAGLLEAYVTAAPAAQAGLMAELPLLAKAAAKGFGEAGIVGLVAAAPDGAHALVLAVLDLLVPRDINKPSQELIAAVRRLRAVRVARLAERGKAEEPSKTAGIEYLVPVLAGLGREGVEQELPALLQADDDIMKKAFRRLTQPTKGATYTPAEIIVLLNRFDYTATGVPMKRLQRALTLCLENKTVYNYPVLREALNVMSQPPAATDQKGGPAKPHQLPLLLMRTVILAVTNFTELKSFVATAVLPRLVQQKVWTRPRIWDGFLICAKMMAKESGATSFIALVQLPAGVLKTALATPVTKNLKEPLKHYAQTLIKVDPGVRAVLGLEVTSNGERK